MANFARILPDLASYVVGLVLPNTWFNQVDGDRVKTINATDGSTHAPTSQINIGGAGLNVTGPLDAAALTATNATINGGSAVFDTSLTVDGCTLDVTSGGAIVMASGSTVELQSGAELVLGANVHPEFSAPRAATYSCVAHLVGMTDLAGGPVISMPGSPIAYIGSDGIGPTVNISSTAVANSGFAMLGLPRVAVAGTVVEAHIFTKGYGGFSNVQANWFALCRRELSGLISTVAGATNDVHTVGDWTTEQVTTLTATVNQTDALGLSGYFIKAGIGATTAMPGGLHITHVAIVVTHQDIRR